VGQCLVEDGVFVRAARGAGALSLQNFASTLLGLVLFMVFARMVSKTEMGVYGAVMLVFSIITIVGGLGLSFTASRFIPYYYGRSEPGKVYVVFKRILMVSLLPLALSLLLLFLSDVFSSWLLKTKDYAYIFAIAAFAAFTSILSAVSSGFLQGLQRFGSLALFTFSSQVVRVGVSVGLLLLGFSVAAIFIGLTTFGVILTILALTSTVKVLLKTKGKANQDEDFFPFKVLFKFALPIMIYQLVIYLSDSVDRFVILGFLGKEALGVYTVVMTATRSVPMTLVASSLLATLVPSMSEAYGRAGIEKISDAFKVSSRYISLILIPACAGFAVLSPLALQILAGSAYVGAALPLSIVSMGVSAYGFSIALLSSLMALGKTLRITIAILLASIIELALCFLFVPLFGVIGAALSRTMMYIFMLGLLVLLGLKLMRISFDKGAVWKSVAGSTVMALLLFLLAQFTCYGLIMLPLYLVFGVMVYLMVLVSLKAIALADVKFLAKIIPKGEHILCSVEKFAEGSSIFSRFLKRAIKAIVK
jgi:O-antigen/teichoic acid export membrane protein